MSIRFVAVVVLMLGSLQTNADDAKLKALQKERLATLQEVQKAVDKLFQGGHVPVDPLLQANAAIADAELELCESQKERLVVLERAVEMAGKAEAYATRTAKIDSPNRMIRSVDVLKAKASRLTAEVAVEKAR